MHRRGSVLVRREVVEDVGKGVEAGTFAADVTTASVQELTLTQGGGDTSAASELSDGALDGKIGVEAKKRRVSSVSPCTPDGAAVSAAAGAGDKPKQKRSKKSKVMINCVLIVKQ